MVSKKDYSELRNGNVHRIARSVCLPMFTRSICAQSSAEHELHLCTQVDSVHFKGEIDSVGAVGHTALLSKPVRSATTLHASVKRV